MLRRTIARYGSVLRQAIVPRPFPGWRRYLLRLCVMGLFLPVFLALQLLHAIGFALDEVLFRGYRKVAIRKPVFVLGVPRSGTTFMHRLLAKSDGMTTFSMWECLFAPSVSERYVWKGVGRLDRAIGRPLQRLIGLAQRKVFGRLDDIHEVRLDAAEEDFYVLMPILACFILVVPFPEAGWLWRMACFDRDVPSAEREALLSWYRRCVQKHLFVHGPDRRFLSKNASFAGMAGSLVRQFPDAQMVFCERDSLQVIRSQFRSLAGGMALFGIPENDRRFNSKLLDCLNFYYENLDHVAARMPADRCYRTSLWRLSASTRQVLSEICGRYGLAWSPALDRAVADYEASRGEMRPAVAPGLDRWGIDEGDVAVRFSAWRHDEEVRI